MTMPLSDLHRRKRLKNFAVLGAVFAWCALMFYVAVIRTLAG